MHVENDISAGSTSETVAAQPDEMIPETNFTSVPVPTEQGRM